MNNYGLYIEANFGYLPSARKVNRNIRRMFGSELVDENEINYTLAKNLFQVASERLKKYVAYNRNYKNTTYNLHDAYGCFLVMNGKKNPDFLWQPPQTAKEKAPEMNYSRSNVALFNLHKKGSKASRKYAESIGAKPLVREDGSTSKRIKTTYRNKYTIRTDPRSGKKSAMLRPFSNGYGWISEDYTALIIPNNKNSKRRKYSYLYDRVQNVSGGEEFLKFYQRFQTKYNKGFTLVVANPIYYAVFLESKGKRVLYGFMDVVKELQSRFGDLRMTTANFHYSNMPIGSARTEEDYKKIASESYEYNGGLVNPYEKRRTHIIRTVRTYKSIGRYKKRPNYNRQGGHKMSQLQRVIFGTYRNRKKNRKDGLDVLRTKKRTRNRRRR